MRHLLLLGAVIMAGASFTAQSAVLRHDVKTPPVSSFLKTACSATQAREVEEPSDLEIIYDAPEGTTAVLTRTCDAFTVEAFEASHSTNIGSLVETVTDEYGDVYIKCFVSEYYTGTWVKAFMENGHLVIEGAQPVYQEYNYDTDEYDTVYLVPLKMVVGENNIGYYVPADELRYEFDVNTDGTLTSVDKTMLLGICTWGADPFDTTGENYTYVWSGYGDRDITLSPVKADLVELPDGAEPEKWVWSDEYELGFANVYVAGTDIYVSGMNRSLTDAWVKGSIDGNTVTIPAGQYMGPDYEIKYHSFFCGADIFYESDPETGENVMKVRDIEDAVFNYDPAAKKLTLVNGYIINSTADRLFPLYGYEGVTVAYQERNPEAAPAAPYDLVYDEGMGSLWFQIPISDVDGKLLDVDNLYYEVYLDGELYTFDPSLYMDFAEPTSLIPYTYQDYDIYVEGTDHTVYIYTSFEKSISVRSIYLNENGDMIPGAKATYYLDSGIEGIDADRTAVAIAYYDFMGRPVSHSATGLVIKKVTYSDGTTAVSKCVRR